MSYRTSERKDGTKYRYPLKGGEDYDPIPLSVIQSPQTLQKTLYTVLPDGRKVYLVDGTYIRDNLDTSFTMGSHAEVDDFVPEGEIWVDMHLAPKDRDALVFHEVLENDLMKDQGWTYEEAHDYANKLEKDLRKEM